MNLIKPWPAAASLAGLLAALAWAAGPGKIAGRVVDSQNGQGLPGVYVEILGARQGALTDDQGHYHIVNLPPGNYSVKAFTIGYQAVTQVDVRCNPDLTARVNFRLRPAPIETEGVMVTAQRPIVDKDRTSTLRIISSSDFEQMPWDNLRQAVAVQSGVVRMGEDLHVRGGRSDEVDYLIDGISVRDATEGHTGLLVNTNALSELSLLTGVYNAEYGQAMSGVISASIKEGREPKLNLKWNDGGLFPDQQGRGFRLAQADWGRPLWGSRLLLFGAGDVSRSDDWDPHRLILPHQEREDYSWLGKATVKLPARTRLSLLAAGSRSQFGRYGHDWLYMPGNYRSDLRKGLLACLTLNQSLSNSAFWQLSLGRFWNRGQFGVRDTFWDIGRHWWEDIRFFDYWDNQIYYDQDGNLVFTAGYNPYGYDRMLFFRQGNYWQYRDRTTEERFLKGDFLLQAGPRHQLKAGTDLKWYDVSNFHLYATALGKPIIDHYRKEPTLMALYLQDKVEYEGLVVNGGLRLQRLDPKTGTVDSVLLSGAQSGNQDGAGWSLSPRLGLSYVVSKSTTFHFGYGRFFQAPLLQQLYQYVTMEDPGQIKGNILGNPGLKPQRATSIEFGTVNELNPDVSLDLALYYRETKDLISIDLVQAKPVNFYQYVNVERANTTGLEACLRKHFGRHLTGSLRYSLSKAVGTGSNPADAMERSWLEAVGETLDVVERTEIPLDFDQRNKLVAEISLFNRGPGPVLSGGQGWAARAGRLLSDASLNMIFHYGSGLPFTPLALEGLNQEPPAVNSQRYPASKQLDLRLIKAFHAGPFALSLVLEVLNVFDWDNGNSTYSREAGPYEIYTREWQPQPPRMDYTGISPYYDAEGDLDGDGVFSVAEQRTRWDYFKKLYAENPAMTGAPLLLRTGLQGSW
jgi:outer membrane receptor protein involved in Fe transport